MPVTGLGPACRTSPPAPYTTVLPFIHKVVYWVCLRETTSCVRTCHHASAYTPTLLHISYAIFVRIATNSPPQLELLVSTDFCSPPSVINGGGSIVGRNECEVMRGLPSRHERMQRTRTSVGPTLGLTRTSKMWLTARVRAPVQCALNIAQPTPCRCTGTRRTTALSSLRTIPTPSRSTPP